MKKTKRKPRKPAWRRDEDWAEEHAKSGFPLSLPISARTLEEWGECERGSWEDHDRPDEGHVYSLLGRRRTRLLIESLDELVDLYESIRLNTMDVHMPRAQETWSHRLQCLGVEIAGGGFWDAVKKSRERPDEEVEEE